MLRIVFIHGLGCSAGSFLPLLASIQDMLKPTSLTSYDMVALPQHKVGSHTIHYFDKLAFELVQSFPKTDRILIIAHSMGSAIALPLAVQIPQQLVGLALIEGNLIGSDCQTLSQSLARFKDGHFDAEFIAMVQRQSGPGWTQWKEDHKKYDPILLSNYADTLVTVSRRGTLLKQFENIRSPSIFIFGDDYLRTPKQPRREVLSLLPRESLRYVRRTGHFVMQDAPNTCARYIIEMLEDSEVPGVK